MRQSDGEGFREEVVDQLFYLDDMLSIHGGVSDTQSIRVQNIGMFQEWSGV